jgi:hypothetical protein
MPKEMQFSGQKSLANISLAKGRLAAHFSAVGRASPEDRIARLDDAAMSPASLLGG